MLEYVTSKEELISLVAGTIRYALEQEPIRYTDMAGGGMQTSPEVRVIANFTGISKAKNPQRVISLKVNLGVVNRYAADYKERLVIFHEAIRKDFPVALEGGFE